MEKNFFKNSPCRPVSGTANKKTANDVLPFFLFKSIPWVFCSLIPEVYCFSIC
ncbi:hypothetical protein AB434_1380 [Heyndrickxia coagulans]|uniref:Uncharacterized protein n=1 Tax=Heyndrickxia coagulans TaxID=1398 RepID=A0AAN0TB72_HEYCO|nr:hypothetical protein SB48_HM08orf06299 [Heyndrickxia coagulans]AKN53785.1 hypothetical protein AB434_1380 [Heyndrickxia coagulans]